MSDHTKWQYMYCTSESGSGFSFPTAFVAHSPMFTLFYVLPFVRSFTKIILADMQD